MMKIAVRGEIVSSAYDSLWFAEDIEKGVLTPSNRVVDALAAVPDGGSVEIRVDSPGGDVFAGAAIIQAIRAALARGCAVSVEVGALAISMAANIVAACRASGCPASAHANSMLMFHGCYCATKGGAEAHGDHAKALSLVNDSVKADLAKIGVTDVDGWFAEGREMWMSAAEALERGIVTEVDGQSAPSGGMEMCGRMGMRIAACLKERMDDGGLADSVPMARFAGLQAAKDKQIAEMQARLDAVAAANAEMESQKAEMCDRLSGSEKSLAEANAKVSAMETDIAVLRRDLGEASKQLAAERKAHKQVLAAAFAGAGETGNGATAVGRVAGGVRVIES